MLPRTLAHFTALELLASGPATDQQVGLAVLQRLDRSSDQKDREMFGEQVLAELEVCGLVRMGNPKHMTWDITVKGSEHLDALRDYDGELSRALPRVRRRGNIFSRANERT